MLVLIGWKGMKALEHSYEKVLISAKPECINLEKGCQGNRKNVQRCSGVSDHSAMLVEWFRSQQYYMEN